MLNIAESEKFFTMVNEYTCSKDNQEKLVELVIEATENVLKHQPGFIGSAIHKSTDGIKVFSYTQWDSADDVDNILTREELSRFLKRGLELAEFENMPYQVCSVIKAAS